VRRAVALLGLGLVAGLASCTTQVDGTGSLPDPHNIVLQTTDLPNWDESRSSDSNDDKAFDQEFDRCIGPISGPSELSSADSPDFEHSDAFISSTARIMRSSADIATDISFFLDPALGRCLSRAMRTGLAKDAPKGAHVALSELRFRKRVAGEPSRLAALGSGTITFTGSGHTLRFYLDMALLAGQRSESLMVFMHVDKPFTAAFKYRVMNTVANRLA
jgi:hypothetical protein